MIECIGVVLDYARCWWCGQEGVIELRFVQDGKEKKAPYQHGLCMECSKGGDVAFARRQLKG